MRIVWRVIALFLILLIPLGCSTDVPTSNFTGQVPVVRVLLAPNKDSALLSGSGVATATIGASGPISVPLTSTGVKVTRTVSGWKVGNQLFPAGDLSFAPSSGTALAVNGTRYRGRLRFQPGSNGADKFDTVNELDIESYLKGVLPKELPYGWHMETYKAQAIVARTYALYEVKTSSRRGFDLYSDTQSQVYGGLDAETRKSVAAVDSTSGVVIAYGPEGKERIFKSYFSSCCGGITQSAPDAFNVAYIEPLSDQDVKGRCNASPRFNWGPVAVKKDELTRRFRLFGQRRDRAEKNMASVARIEVQQANRFGRPVRFVVIDTKGARFSWTGEEIRWAINTDAAEGSTVYSSFFKIINEADTIRFVDGHGWGHGVGMCQWCAEALAEQGMVHEDILQAAFQRSKRKNAY